MITYSDIGALTAPSAAEAQVMIDAEIIPSLVGLWTAAGGDSEIVEVRNGDWRYLFDLTAERLVCAFGVVAQRPRRDRDTARMRGFPKPPQGYVKGHAIAHQLGGGVDINLLPQDAITNGGAFRVLEREAARYPGSFYFSHWIYPDRDSQTPSEVVQGLVRARELTRPPSSPSHGNALSVEIARHRN
jgi:hypothetical protein